MDTLTAFRYDGHIVKVNKRFSRRLSDAELTDLEQGGTCMNPLLKGIEYLGHASIRLTGEKTCYVDPFQIEHDWLDADVIFITHSHHDHFSPEDIRRVRRAETLLVCPHDCQSLAAELGWHNSLLALAGESGLAAGISYETVAAFNQGKTYHPMNRGWVGYVITWNGVRIYVSGDTDVIPEMSQVRCDVAFLPVGGKYTMTAAEAIEAATLIRPGVAVPTHYGVVSGSEEDAAAFTRGLPEGIEGVVMEKPQSL